MTEYHSKPQPGDKRNVSQDDILQNFLYLAGTVESPNTGIITVDHNSSGNTATGPTDGYHKQVSMNAKAQPANRQNIVNGQTADIILYAKNDTLLTNAKPQLNVLTSTGASPTVNYQVTPCLPLRAAVNFDGTGAVTIRSFFNIASVARTSAGRYTVTFTDQLPTNTYIVSLSWMGDANTGTVGQILADATGNYGNSVSTTLIKLQFFNQIVTSHTNPVMVNLLIYGG